MKRKAAVLIMATVLTMTCISACGSASSETAAPPEAAPAQPAETPAAAEEAPAAAEEAEEDEASDVVEPDYKTYKDKRGWSVEYDAAVTKLEDNTDPADEVTFTYIGEAERSNYLTISFAEGKLPSETIKTIKDIQEPGSKIEVSGGIFPGTTDKWGYWIDFDYPADAKDRESFILTEYQGGTLEFHFVSHKTGNDDIDIPVSDADALIIDSLTFDDFGPQTMYDGIPGIYEQTVTEEIEGEETTATYTLSLANDHTGVLSIQDDVAIQWDDKMIRTEDGSQTYHYTLEGDKLILDYDDMKMEFTKSDGEGRINPPVIADMEKYESVISTLPKGSYIAFVEINNGKESENDAMLVAKTDTLFDNGEGEQVCTEATVYGIDKDGKIKEYGDAISGGTAVPLSTYNGCLYYGNHSELTHAYIDEEKSEFITETSTSFDDIDNVTEVYFFPAESDETASGDAGSDDLAPYTGSLPEYKYTGTDELERAVYEGVVSEYGKHFEKADVCIPYIQIGFKDESKDDDIVVMGDFWVGNYNLRDDTLEHVSGGSFPGAIHLKKDGNKYIVIKTEVVEDGSAWEASAKKIFGDHFNDVTKLINDEAKAREKIRTEIISDYVKANDLKITQYKDYGWDPVKLP